jgi:hypothetical protein
LTSTTKILNAYGVLGVKALRQDLEKVNATGETVKSVRYEVKSKLGVDSLKYLARKWTSLLESGRGKTNKGVSREFIENMEKYVRVRGIQWSKNGKAQTVSQMAWALAIDMNKRGDKTFRQGGRNVYSNTVVKLADEITLAVRKEFRIKFIQTIKGASIALLIMMSSCGSIQTINGVRINHKKPIIVRAYCPVNYKQKKDYEWNTFKLVAFIVAPFFITTIAIDNTILKNGSNSNR